MCLELNKKRTQRFRKKFVNGKMQCYKVIRKDGRPIIYNYSNFKYNYGWNISDRINKTLSDIEDRWNEIYSGIHVYTNIKMAQACSNSNEIVVPVTCHLKDFVGYGSQEAVFMKIFITKKNYNKYMVEKF